MIEVLAGWPSQAFVCDRMVISMIDKVFEKLLDAALLEGFV